MKRVIAFLFCSLGWLCAQSATTRTVVMTWTNPGANQTGVEVLSSTSATGPFTFLGCTGTVAGQTCVSGSTASTATFTDPSETVGTTVYYELIAIFPACAADTTTTTGSSTTVACGNSAAAGPIAVPISPRGTGITAGSIVIIEQ